MAARGPHHDLNAWLDRHGYRHAHAKKTTKPARRRHHATMQEVSTSDAWNVAMDAILERDPIGAARIVEEHALREMPSIFFKALSKVPKSVRSAFEKATGLFPSDHQLQEELPEYHGWRSTYEYPGFVHYRHPLGDFGVTASSDFDGDGKLNIQIQAADFSRSLNDGENSSWPFEDRTAKKMFARIRPYLDKYQPRIEQLP